MKCVKINENTSSHSHPSAGLNPGSFEPNKNTKNETLQAKCPTRAMNIHQRTDNNQSCGLNPYPRPSLCSQYNKTGKPFTQSLRRAGRVSSAALSGLAKYFWTTTLLAQNFAAAAKCLDCKRIRKKNSKPHEWICNARLQIQAFSKQDIELGLLQRLVPSQLDHSQSSDVTWHSCHGNIASIALLATLRHRTSVHTM